ncbi:MAG: hypothetical protein EXQ57_00750 [Bryobacterales bacterium]|nr:hypothetical protein [Bryobacterales bacterium]
MDIHPDGKRFLPLSREEGNGMKYPVTVVLNVSDAMRRRYFAPVLGLAGGGRARFLGASVARGAFRFAGPRKGATLDVQQDLHFPGLEVGAMAAWAQELVHQDVEVRRGGGSDWDAPSFMGGGNNAGDRGG